MTNVDLCPYVVAHNDVYEKNTPLINIRFFYVWIFLNTTD